MADPFVAEITHLSFQLRTEGLGLVRWAVAAAFAEHGALLAAGHDLRRGWQVNLRLPDLQGRAPMHPGQGPGLSLHDLGETGGSETVTLLESEIPAHAHALRASSDDADLAIPTPARTLAKASANLYVTTNPNAQMAPEALAPAGGDQPHNNMMPYLTFYFNIALQGVFPARP